VTPASWGADLVTVRSETAGVPATVSGAVILEDPQGGVLLLDRGGRYWSLPAEQIREKTAAGEAFGPLTGEKLGEELRRELGSSFEVVRTEHYVLCTDAGRKFAEWTGRLLERLYVGFEEEWTKAGVELVEAPFPLPVLLFAREADYREYARRDVGSVPVDMGYYSSLTNRVALRDLTPASNRNPDSDLSKIVSPANVTTLVHEATHQLAFNRGLHVRLADNPMWLTEGVAMYFESPDLRNSAGWKTTGNVNRTRIQRFRDYARNRRQPDSLETLVRSNGRFAKPDTAADAYAEGWLLVHFLRHKHPEEYVAFLKTLAAKRPLDIGTDEDRLAAFRAAFGEDLSKLDKELQAYASRLAR
jgi:hypothetical protein